MANPELWIGTEAQPALCSARSEKEMSTTIDLLPRTPHFAIEIIRLVTSLPANQTCSVLGTPLLRVGTSVGANYRAARRSRSRADFIARMEIVEEEADKCIYWLELLQEADETCRDHADRLRLEPDELTAIAVTSILTARKGPRT